MKYEIVKVHTEPENAKDESGITKVKLSNSDVLKVSTVVYNIDNGTDYYFTASNGSQPEVESVHPDNSSAYIRTKPNNITSDNLLSLDRF